MGDTRVCQFTSEKEGVVYYAKTNWERGNFYITLVENDTNTAWKGNVSEGQLKAMAETVHMNASDFLTETQCALTGTQKEYMEKNQYSYLVDEKQFIWKKVSPSEPIKFRLGSIPLHQVPLAEVLPEMLDFCLHQNQQLRETVQKLEESERKLKADRVSIMTKFESCVSEKEKQEMDLFGKFVQVLNMKKAKIRDLRELLKEEGEDQENTSGQTSPSTEKKIKKEATTSAEMGGESDSSSDAYAGDTDVDEIDTDDERERKKVERLTQKQTHADTVKTSDELFDLHNEGCNVLLKKRSRVPRSKAVCDVALKTHVDKVHSRESVVLQRKSTKSSKESDIDSESLLQDM